MSKSDWDSTRGDERSLSPDLGDVERKLRDARPEVSALDLDRIKMRAMSQARRSTGRVGRQGVLVRNKLVATLASGVLVVSGGSVGALAWENEHNGGDHNGGNDQYCPPKDGKKKKDKKGGSHKTCPKPQHNSSHKSHSGSHKSHGGDHQGGDGDQGGDHH
jgi:hypothetical protein